jgi:hypothetical protein
MQKKYNTRKLPVNNDGKILLKKEHIFIENVR